MTLAITVVVAIAVVAVAAIVFGRSMSLTFRDLKATVDDTNKAVGQGSGNGDLSTMGARALGELAEIRAEQEAVKAKLEQRTHVTRSGNTEPEELGPYIQSWFHDINTSLTVIHGTLAILWTALERDYDLPVMPSFKRDENT